MIAYVVSIGAGVLLVLYTGWSVMDGVRRSQRLGRARTHAWVAERVAFEASLEDPALDPDTIREAIAAMVDALADAWSSGDADALIAQPDGAELNRWRRRLESTTPADLRRLDRTETDLLEVVNRAGHLDDHVVASVAIRLRSTRRSLESLLGLDGMTIVSRWTLIRADAGWIVSTISEVSDSCESLDAPTIAGPFADLPRLHAESTLELATADARETALAPIDLVSANGSPMDAVSEIALIDARFEDAVFDTVLRRLLAAWESAGHGRPGELHRLATQAAAERLLHPAREPNAHTVVRELRLREFAPVRIGGDDSTLVTLRVVAEGIRYVRDLADPAPIAGSPLASHTLEMTWTLALVSDPEIVWRLQDADDPSRQMYWLP